MSDVASGLAVDGLNVALKPDKRRVGECTAIGDQMFDTNGKRIVDLPRVRALARLNLREKALTRQPVRIPTALSRATMDAEAIADVVYRDHFERIAQGHGDRVSETVISAYELELPAGWWLTAVARERMDKLARARGPARRRLIALYRGNPVTVVEQDLERAQQP